MSFSSEVRSVDALLSSSRYLDDETHPVSKPATRSRTKGWLLCIRGVSSLRVPGQRPSSGPARCDLARRVAESCWGHTSGTIERSPYIVGRQARLSRRILG